jgi:hypothetical protein
MCQACAITRACQGEVLQHQIAAAPPSEHVWQLVVWGNDSTAPVALVAGKEAVPALGKCQLRMFAPQLILQGYWILRPSSAQASNPCIFLAQCLPKEGHHQIPCRDWHIPLTSVSFVSWKQITSGGHKGD